MKVYRFAFVVASLLFGGVSAFADLLPATFDGVNGAIAFGYYVGPYSGTLNGAPVTFYCVDFNNDVYFGESWMANLTPLNGSSDLSNTRYGGAAALPNALTLYREAAWLTTQYAGNPGAYGDIQATIWQLFDSSAPTPSTNQWLIEAQDNYQTLDFSNWDVVTNANVQLQGQVQEFIIDPAPVPEPSSIILFGTFLLALCAFLRPRLAKVAVAKSSRE